MGAITKACLDRQETIGAFAKKKKLKIRRRKIRRKKGKIEPTWSGISDDVAEGAAAQAHRSKLERVGIEHVGDLVVMRRQCRNAILGSEVAGCSLIIRHLSF